MKYLLIAASLLVSSALPARVSGQTQPPSLAESPRYTDLDDDGPLTEPRHIGFNMTPDDVVIAMKGKPDEKLAPDLWVYWRFRAASAAELPAFDTLVVYFSQGRVVKYRLVEGKPILALLAEVRKNAKAGATVAKK